MSKIEIKKGSSGSEDRTGFLDTWCGDYCFRVENIKISRAAMTEYQEKIKALDWVSNDRLKLFIFILSIAGAPNEIIFNLIFDGTFLTNPVYCNLYNAGCMNKTKINQG